MPVPIAPGALHTIPLEVVEIIHELKHFIVEKARTARRFIKSTDPPYRIEELMITELRREMSFDLEALIAPIEAGHSVGLMSEAGCPAVADPGAHVVQYAHQQGITVVPLTGPSSIMMALMASGMNGQHFCFHGYIPAKRDRLGGALKRLENKSRELRRTEIFIEAPHRNHQVFTAAITALARKTLLCIATHITDSDEEIRTASIAEWEKSGPPDFHKKPTIFLLYAR